MDVHGKLKTANPDITAIASAMRQINSSWLAGQPDAMASLLTDQVAMALPDFSGTIQGRDAIIGSFRDFCTTAVLHECLLAEPDVTVSGPVGVATYSFVVVYERGGQRWRSTGRDVWVFGREGSTWKAAWRVMLDPLEKPAE